MKRYIAILFTLLATGFAFAQQEPNEPATQQEVAAAETTIAPLTPEQTWMAANEAYNRGEWARATELYESILSEQKHSAELYFNLGNAYYKQEMLGKAIVNYNRALRLSPADEDILHNLEYATQATKDNIEEIPTFFLIEWVRNVRNLMGCNAWTIISLIALVLTLLAMLIYLLAESLSRRKAGFYSMCVVAIVFLVSTIFAYQSYQALVNSNEAVIMSSAVPVKSSPDRAATDLFVVHEGTKLSLGECIDGWVEIRIADGRKGWIETSRIEII